MESPRGGCRAGGTWGVLTAGVVVCTAFLAPAVRAEGIPVGKWSFFPSLVAVWQDESNLFLTAGDPLGSSSYAVRPRLMWQLAFRDSDIRLSYSPQVREFIDREAQERGLDGRYYSHFYEADTKFGFSNRLQVKLKHEFAVDTFDTSAIDVGGEVVFNNNQYRRHRADLEVVKEVYARHGVGMHGIYDALDFDEESSLTFVNYERAGGGLVYVYKLTPLSSLRFSYGLERGSQDHPPTSVVSGQDDYRRREGRFVWQASLARGGLIEARLGYLSWRFDSSGVSDFGGLTGELRYTTLLGTQSRVSVMLARTPLPSFFNVNSYYLSQAFEARLAREREGSRLACFLAGGYRLNDYPEPLTLSSGVVIGPEREDRTVRGEVGVGYKFNELMRAEIRFRRENRNSNIENLGYNTNRVLLQFSVGWY